MIGFKLISAGCLLVAVAQALYSRIDSEFVQISQEWFDLHGCPHQVYFMIDCNLCYNCWLPGSKLVHCNPQIKCFYTPSYDYWSYSANCSPGQNFYLGCRYCRCGVNGFGTTCDDRACKYYPNTQN